MGMVKMDKVYQIKREETLNEWTEMVCKCRNSGLNVREWCKENGINIKSYYYRLKRVKDRICEKTSEKHDIVPLEICTGNSSTVSGNVAIIIKINGAEIEVQKGTDTQTLRSILSVLKSI